MVFTKRLRDGVRRGEITCSVRFWLSPRVRVGSRYPMEEGAILIDSIELIGFPDITPELARESGFLGVLDMLKIAKHGKGGQRSRGTAISGCAAIVPLSYFATGSSMFEAHCFDL